MPGVQQGAWGGNDPFHLRAESGDNDQRNVMGVVFSNIHLMSIFSV